MAKSPTVKEMQKALREFDKTAAKMRKEIAEVRKSGVGILTPQLINRHLRSGQDLVLAYGRQGLTQQYTLQDLKRFADQINNAARKYQSHTKGVPLLQLEASSLPIDKQRARAVRNARLYKIDGNMLYFRVSGVQQAYYQVRIRMEDWGKLASRVHASAASVAKMAAMGNLSIDCQCGRHQYWYRYLANIGAYDVSPPKEQGFPKIRNPRLTGCCCKHVLKVLAVLKTTAIHNVLAREVERVREKTTFADEKSRRFLSQKELKETSRVRGLTSKTPKEARQALRDFLKSAREALDKEAQKQSTQAAKKKLKPRKPTQKPQRTTSTQKTPQRGTTDKRFNMDEATYKTFVAGVGTALTLVRQGLVQRDQLISNLAQTNGLTVNQVEQIIKNEKLED